MATDYASANRQAPAGRRTHVGNVRWGIAVLLGVGILINYFDRINISVATKPLETSFHLTTGEMGIILSSYLWSYTLMQIPIGALLDRIGVKWLMRVGTILWTIATLATAVAGGLGIFILARIVLGVAEAPAFPGASKATGYWFPLGERGRATSAFDGAAKFSNVIGVPIVALAVTQWGWQGGFWVTGILSGLFAIAFWIWYRNPREERRSGRLSQAEYTHIVQGGFWVTGILSGLFAIAFWIWYRDPREERRSGRLSQAEYTHIVQGGAQREDAVPASAWRSLGYVLRQRKVWGLTLGFAAYGYSFYLLLTWLPGYLETQLHMTVLKSGWYTIIPWIVATITDLLIGGWLVDHLIARGLNPTRVRKTLLVIGMVLGLAVIGAAFTNDANVAIFWISIALGGLAFSAPIGWSIPALIAPEGTVGTVGSVMNFFNNLLGIAAPIVTGIIAGSTGSFAIGFIVAAVVLLVGILCYVFLLGNIEQIPMPPEQVATADTSRAPGTGTPAVS